MAIAPFLYFPEPPAFARRLRNYRPGEMQDKLKNKLVEKLFLQF